MINDLLGQSSVLQPLQISLQEGTEEIILCCFGSHVLRVMLWRWYQYFFLCNTTFICLFVLVPLGNLYTGFVSFIQWRRQNHIEPTTYIDNHCIDIFFAIILQLCNTTFICLFVLVPLGNFNRKLRKSCVSCGEDMTKCIQAL